MSILSDYTFQIVTIGAFLLGGISGVLGSFAVLRKQSLLGDGVSHSALAGVVLAFMLSGSKNNEVLLVGGLISGLISSLLINLIVKKTKIKYDSALAFVMSVFFGLGLVLLTLVQKQDNSTQAGLERFIYGQSSAMMLRDVRVIFACGIVLLALVLMFWKEFKLITFDIEFAQTIGFNTNKLDLLLTIMIVITVIIGLQTVGVILMSAMLIAPSVGARQWANSLSSMVIISALFGGLSAFIGTVISSTINQIPTGPAIVICSSIITFLSIGIAPKLKKYEGRDVFD